MKKTIRKKRDGKYDDIRSALLIFEYHEGCLFGVNTGVTLELVSEISGTQTEIQSTH